MRSSECSLTGCNLTLKGGFSDPPSALDQGIGDTTEAFEGEDHDSSIDHNVRSPVNCLPKLELESEISLPMAPSFNGI